MGLPWRFFAKYSPTHRLYSPSSEKHRSQKFPPSSSFRNVPRAVMTVDASIQEVLVNPMCWFCCEPIRPGERANRVPQAELAVHSACLRQDTLADGREPGEPDLTTAA